MMMRSKKSLNRKERRRENVKAYTADELEEMDMEELEQDIDRMFEEK